MKLLRTLFVACVIAMISINAYAYADEQLDNATNNEDLPALVAQDEAEGPASSIPDNNDPAEESDYSDLLNDDGNLDEGLLDDSSLLESALEPAEQELISFDPKEETYLTGQEIKIQINVEGATDGFQYKYVWEKDNWKDWGVLRQFDADPLFIWTPEKPGSYTIYIDVKDENGTCTTYRKDIDVKISWVFESIALSDSSPHARDAIEIGADVSGDPDGLMYKFVWEKDNWKKWGVIEGFSELSFVTWIPEEGKGSYSIYIDIRDPYGNTATQSTTLTVRENWTFDSATYEPASTIHTGDTIILSAETSGDTESIEYKFVWMQDNWKNWGVLKNRSSDNTCEWVPKKPGTYTIYYDAIGSDETKTLTRTFNVSSAWSHKGIKTQNSIIALRDPVQIDVSIEGFTENLLCKIVWERDGWKQWGIVSDFCDVFKMEWMPESGAGSYTLYADVKDPFGNVETKTASFTYTDEWTYESVEVNPSSGWGKRETITITPKTTGYVKDLTYKYVWQRNGSWQQGDWGVISDFSAASSMEWEIPDSKSIRIYVDVKDPSGKTISHYIDLSPIKTTIWHIDDVSVDIRNVEMGETATISVETSGETDDLQYKFVWMYNNWKNWAVGKSFSPENTYAFEPEKPGDYTIYIDVRGDDGIVETKTIDIHVWTFPKGVKASVKNGIATIWPDFGCTLDENPGYSFKYVWSFNNWMHWDSIFHNPDFVEDMSATIPLDYCGEYAFYIDIRYPDGSIRTFSTTLKYDNLLEKIGGMGMGRTISTFGGFSGLSASGKNKLVAAIDGFEDDGYDVGFIIMDLQTGHGVQYNANQYFYSASTIKGPYVAALCRYVPSSASSWSGTMTNTIEWSSNEDYAALRDAFGGSPMQEIMSDSGIGLVWSPSSWYCDYRPYDLARLWITMYRYFNSNEANARWCSNLYTGSYMSRGYEELSGGDTTTHTKPGWTGFSYPSDMQVYNDAGYVSRNGHDYLYVVLSEDCTCGYNMTRMIYAIDSVSYELR